MTLLGHEAGVNCFSYGTNNIILSGSDDKTIKIWDLGIGKCIETIHCHSEMINSIKFFKELPIFASIGNEGKLYFHNINTYKMINSYNYYMLKGWTIDELNNHLAIGYDEGLIVFKIGNDEPIYDYSNGKMIYSKNHNLYSINLKSVLTEDLKNFEKIDLNIKNLDSLDIFPNFISFSPKGLLVCIADENEFIILKS